MILKQREVIFAGMDDASSKECEFGIYVPSDDLATWLPAITSSSNVIEKLKTLPLGQVFKITASENDGAMGTRIHAIEVDSNAPVYTVPEDRPATLAL
jgi:hypothetical protein